jgi:hypothetical protein
VKQSVKITMRVDYLIRIELSHAKFLPEIFAAPQNVENQPLAQSVQQTSGFNFFCVCLLMPRTLELYPRVL